MSRRPDSTASKPTTTSVSSIRGSHRSSDSRTSYEIRPAVAASAGAKTRSWMAQPNAGRIGRSPGAVARISRMLSATSRSPPTIPIEPVGSVRSGNAQPVPMNSSSGTVPPSVQLDEAGAHGQLAARGDLGLPGAVDGDLLPFEFDRLLPLELDRLPLQQERAVAGVHGDPLGAADHHQVLLLVQLHVELIVPCGQQDAVLLDELDPVAGPGDEAA